METAAASSSQLQRQGTHALFTTLVSVVLGLLLNVIVARALGATGKGLLDLSSATVALFALVFGGSLNAAVTDYVARQATVPALLRLQLGLWAAAAAALSWALLVLFAPAAVRFGFLPATDSDFWTIFIVASVGTGVCAAALRGILIGRNAVITANRIDVAIKAALLVGFAAAAYRGAANPRVFAIVSVAGAALLMGALVITTHGGTAARPGVWRALLAVAAPVHGTNILHFLNQRADVFFVQAFHGTAEVGLYTLAVSLAQCVLLISSALAQPLLPQVSRAPTPGAAAEATASTCRRFLVLGFIATAGLAIGGTLLLPVVFGRDFSASRAALLILLPGMLGFGLTNIFISHFVGRGRSGINVRISLACLIVTLGGNALLTPRLGAIGAAATSSVAYLLAGLLSWACFRRDAAGAPAATLWLRRDDWYSAITMLAHFRV